MVNGLIISNLLPLKDNQTPNYLILDHIQTKKHLISSVYDKLNQLLQPISKRNSKFQNIFNKLTSNWIYINETTKSK